jgi:hypothetical protein
MSGMKIIRSRRKGNYLARFGVFLATVVLIAGMAGCDGCGQHPSQNLEIRTWYDLDTVRNNMEGNHILMNDLDSATAGYEELASPIANGGKGWQPIGFTIPRQLPTGFWGTFDGQGHKILGLFIDRPDEMGVGLFGVAGRLIRDVLVVNATVTGNWGVGGLVGWNENGTVSNCYCSGEITGDERVGGLVGNNCGPLNNSYFVGNVTGNSMVGGLAGLHSDTASDCHSTGSVTGRERVGGLVGLNQGIVTNSYSTSSVTGNEYAGGLVGRAFLDYESGIVSSSLWDTETTGQVASDGGTGKTTAEMMNIATFSGAGWNITAVADSDTRNTAYIWNMVDGETYPFLNWQPVS